MPTPQLSQNGLFDLLWQAGPMAKFVLLLLLSASVFSWGIIISKWRTYQKAFSENTKFLNVFWHSKNVDDVFGKCEKYSYSPIAATFKSGYKELRRVTEENKGVDAECIDNINRALMRASNAEISLLEKHVSWLATTASAAPFVGLFGTVWGIMNAFQNIGATGAANLAIVAPGISEALITTAAGIGAAIPAVIAYNHFAGHVKRLAADMDCFGHDFLNIISRSAMGGKK